MKSLFFCCFTAVALFCNAQGSNPKSTTIKPQSTNAVSADADVKTFSFTGSFTVNYSTVDTAKKVLTGLVKYAFDGYKASVSPSFATAKEISSLRSVFDVKENEMTMMTVFSKGKKSALLLKMPKPTIAPANAKSTAKPPVLKKTGEKKIIQGYNCEKIILIYPDGKRVESWVTAELVLNLTETLRLCNMGFKGKSPFGKTNLNDIKGTALETVITEKNGTSMKITLTDIKKIKPEPALFSTEGFDVKDARGLPMFGE